VILIDEVHGGLDLEQQSIVNGHLLAFAAEAWGWSSSHIPSHSRRSMPTWR